MAKQYNYPITQLDVSGLGNALGKRLRKCVYFADKSYQQNTLPSTTLSFPVCKICENRQKHQRRRGAWVGQGSLFVSNFWI